MAARIEKVVLNVEVRRAEQFLPNLKELLFQCVPAFMLAIHWRGVRAGPALAGLIVGGALAVGAMFGGATRIGGFHTGVISLALNLAITALGSLYLNASRTSSPPYTSTSGAGSK